MCPWARGPALTLLYRRKPSITNSVVRLRPCLLVPERLPRVFRFATGAARRQKPEGALTNVRGGLARPPSACRQVPFSSSGRTFTNTTTCEHCVTRRGRVARPLRLKGCVVAVVLGSVAANGTHRRIGNRVMRGRNGSHESDYTLADAS